MRKFYITILSLFITTAEINAQETASAYAFLIDSILIKELQQYEYLKDFRVAIQVKSSSKESHYTGMENYRGQIFSFYHTTDTAVLNQVIDQSERFDLKKVLSHSTNARKISLLDVNTGYVEMSRLSALQKTSVYILHQAVLSPDKQYCVIFYTHFQQGGYTVVLKKTNEKWKLYSNEMDFII